MYKLLSYFVALLSSHFLKNSLVVRDILYGHERLPPRRHHHHPWESYNLGNTENRFISAQ